VGGGVDGRRTWVVGSRGLERQRRWSWWVGVDGHQKDEKEEIEVEIEIGCRWVVIKGGGRTMWLELKSVEFLYYCIIVYH